MSDQAEVLRELMKSKEIGTKKKPVQQQVVESSSKTRIITFASGKGGVGKTNIATNLGIALASFNKKVVLIDADLGLANINVLLGFIPKYNLYHLIRKQKTLNEIIVHTQYGVKVIAGASGFSRIANLSDAERYAVVSGLLALSEADYIIIDAGAGVSNNVLSFVNAADESIIVTTPEPTSITDAYGIIKIIATETDHWPPKIHLLVNRVQTAIQGKKVAERMSSIAATFLNTKIDYLGYVYDDPKISESVQKQKPFFVHTPRSKASQCILQTAQIIDNVDQVNRKGIKGFLKRLSKNKVVDTD